MACRSVPPQGDGRGDTGHVGADPCAEFNRQEAKRQPQEGVRECPCACLPNGEIVCAPCVQTEMQRVPRRE